MYGGFILGERKWVHRELVSEVARGEIPCDSVICGEWGKREGSLIITYVWV